jgi:hypothetical protein
MIWVYVKSAPANLLLDDYPNAAVAFGLFKLRTAYAGSAIRIRRSNDNAEQDIGFSGTDLDTSAISSFVGSNSAFVTTFYDQSGNGQNWTQSTAGSQPRIVNAGTLETFFGKPTMFRNDTFIGFAGATITGTSSCMSYTVMQLNSGSSVLITEDGSSKYYATLNNGDSGSAQSNVGSPLYYKDGTLITGANRDVLYDNFISDPSILTVKDLDLSSWTNYRTNYGFGFQAKCYFSAHILYTSQSNSQSGIEGVLNDYYGIF